MHRVEPRPLLSIDTLYSIEWFCMRTPKVPICILGCPFWIRIRYWTCGLVRLQNGIKYSPFYKMSTTKSGLSTPQHNAPSPPSSHPSPSPPPNTHALANTHTNISPHQYPRCIHSIFEMCYSELRYIMSFNTWKIVAIPGYLYSFYLVILIITKTCLYNCDPLIPLLYSKTGVYRGIH